jgi:hypothetical protein
MKKEALITDPADEAVARLRAVAEQVTTEGYATVQTCRLCPAEQIVSDEYAQSVGLPPHLHEDDCPVVVVAHALRDAHAAGLQAGRHVV